jgi:hypothetical protein
VLLDRQDAVRLQEGLGGLVFLEEDHGGTAFGLESEIIEVADEFDDHLLGFGLDRRRVTNISTAFSSLSEL